MKLYCTFIFSALASIVLCSCTTYKTTAKNHTINKEFPAQLKADKKYRFFYESVQVLQITIDSVRGESIYGRIPAPRWMGKATGKIAFTASFETIDNNVTQIKRRRFNPYLTVLAIGIPAGLIAVTADGMAGNMTFP